MMNPLSPISSPVQKLPITPQSIPSTPDQIDVAVAVIHYNNYYLLGYRHAKQDQGDRYEFIGGKIDRNELPMSALEREIDEEIGLTLNQGNIINRLGVLHHEYPSKTVCLHVYRVGLTRQQFTEFKDKKVGCEGQKLVWVQYKDLIDYKYELPEANATILAWLRLPNQITISYDCINKLTAEIETFESKPSKTVLTEEWVNLHCQHLARHACVYIRLKSVAIATQLKLLNKLCQRRKDIQLILNVDIVSQLQLLRKLNSQLSRQLIAQHVTHQQLDSLYQLQETFQVNDVLKFQKHNTQSSVLANLPLTVSCHSLESIRQANVIAKRRLKMGLSPLIGIYLSPVLATSTHPNAKPLQWEGFGQLAQCAQIPVIALGGMSPKYLECVRKYGGDKVAGISQFYQ